MEKDNSIEICTDLDAEGFPTGSPKLCEAIKEAQQALDAFGKAARKALGQECEKRDPVKIIQVLPADRPTWAIYRGLDPLDPSDREEHAYVVPFFAVSETGTLYPIVKGIQKRSELDWTFSFGLEDYSSENFIGLWNPVSGCIRHDNGVHFDTLLSSTIDE